MPDPRVLPALRAPVWTRRRFALVGAALGLAPWLGRPRPARAGGGPRILIAGDSMIAGGFGLFLERALRDEHGLEVVRRGKTSSGLARPDFFDWLAEARRIVANEPFPVNVVMFGGNDVQGLYLGKHGGKAQWIRWPDDGWAEEYARRVDAFCDILAPNGEYVLWVGLPVMRPPKFQARVERVNAIYRERMDARPGAAFLDTSKVLVDEAGQYADRIVLTPSAEGMRAKKVRVRAGDGIHLSPAGAHHMKAFTLTALLPALAVR